MIFSDKTGTLTMNKMIFKKCQINGAKYGEIMKNEVNLYFLHPQINNEEGMVESSVELLRKEIKSEK